MKWVVAQTALLLAAVACWFLPPRPGQVAHVVGGVLFVGGVILLIAARLSMGRSFTVMPRPRAGGELVTGGPFRIVRNPIYLAALVTLTGGSLFNSWTGLAPTAALAVLWAGKVRVEERYLREQFPEYADYARRVRYRLLPFVY